MFSKRKYKTIQSIKELPSVLRRQIVSTALTLGTIALIGALLAFFICDPFPIKSDSVLLSCIDWIVNIGLILGSFGFVAAMTAHLMLTYHGYVLFPNAYHSDCSSQKRFSSYDSTIHTANNYATSVSINPSSNLPMSGSSGMDISGNPYGTRSW